MNKIKNLFFILLVVLTIIFTITSIKDNKNKANRSAKEFKKTSEEKNSLDIKKYYLKRTKNSINSDLSLSAASAIVFDQNTGEIIYEKDPHRKLAPASITKIATFAVALENLKPNDLIEISPNAASQISNKINMKPGEKLYLYDLLYGLMMISANDAAWAIAEAIPGGFDAFINKMNNLVSALSLKDTHFQNPAGLDDDNHYSSAYDIATITRYTLIEHPELVKYAGRKEEYSIYPSEHNESHWWKHISSMLYRYPGLIAAKTGYTDIAKSTFVGIAERDGRRLVIVFLGSSDANNDVIKLFDYGFAHKSTIN